MSTYRRWAVLFVSIALIVSALCVGLTRLSADSESRLEHVKEVLERAERQDLIRLGDGRVFLVDDNSSSALICFRAIGQKHATRFVALEAYEVFLPAAVLIKPSDSGYAEALGVFAAQRDGTPDG